MFSASVLLAFLVALPATVALAATAVLVGLTVLVLVGYGSAEVSLHDGVFRAGRASIPATLLADPEPLDRARTRAVAGVEADARAYLLIRPYVPQSVRVRVTDAADPTPYWLVSTRHPTTLAEELATAIAEGSAAGGR
jgi:hypothetical protein